MTWVGRLIVIAAVLLLGLWAAASASASKPTREPNLIPPTDFPAGFGCEFPRQIIAVGSGRDDFALARYRAG